MMKGPGLFSDIGKKAKDLLNKDYTYDQKLSISTFSTTGVGLTSTAVKKGGLYTLDVGSQYKYNNTLLDVKIDTESKVSTTLIFNEILPSTKAIASLKLPDMDTGKLEVQYFHHHGSFSSSVGLKSNPNVDISATVGAQGVSFGAEAGYDTATGGFTKYTAGFGLTKNDYTASIILADKGDTLKASYLRHLGPSQRASVVAEITRKLSTNSNSLMVGAACSIDPQTTFKARLNDSGKLAMLLQHEVREKSFLTVCGEFDTKAMDRTPKFGLGLAMKP